MALNQPETTVPKLDGRQMQTTIRSSDGVEFLVQAEKTRPAVGGSEYRGIRSFGNAQTVAVTIQPLSYEMADWDRLLALLSGSSLGPRISNVDKRRPQISNVTWPRVQNQEFRVVLTIDPDLHPEFRHQEEEKVLSVFEEIINANPLRATYFTTDDVNGLLNTIREEYRDRVNKMLSQKDNNTTERPPGSPKGRLVMLYQSPPKIAASRILKGTLVDFSVAAQQLAISTEKSRLVGILRRKPEFYTEITKFQDRFSALRVELRVAGDVKFAESVEPNNVKRLPEVMNASIELLRGLVESLESSE